MKRLAGALLILVLAPAIGFAQTTHVVVQKGRRFAPAEVTLHQGESLTFTNEDEFIHQMYTDGLFDSDEKAPGERLVQIFSSTGTFEVHCHIHPKMKLIVHVN